MLDNPPADPESALSLAARLAAQREWSLARDVLAHAEGLPGLSPALLRRLRQQRAMCTYKDTELRRLPALEQALALLASAGEDLSDARDPETLALAGAIHKRMWEISGRRSQLVTAMAYYLRATRAADGSDSGYSAINAAFLLDVLAAHDERAAQRGGVSDDAAAGRRAQAAQLRREILAASAGAAEHALAAPRAEDWWLIATVAEADFGLGLLDDARRLLGAAGRIPELPDWQLESTVRQLAWLARLNEPAGGPRSAIVAELAGLPPQQSPATVGRVGLALSGGGFRAAFFHLGVLARLAELDMLRHVEVLSCVSGGSIVGAHYYLELRRRLESRHDDEMSREEYIDIVRTVQRDFYAATCRNLRWHGLTNPVAVLRTLAQPGYNRTRRVGELLDEWIYRPLVGGERPVLGRLGITPLDGPRPFDPFRHNWRRSAKVPLLIINATSLNTGHNWQFTTAWMGEPYAFIDDRTDANYRLGRVRLVESAPGGAESLSLGQAVAASASVPGLLEPLRLERLYPGKSVRLSDGGVHDNQGIYALLAQDCTVVLVSDASGQMNAQDRPKVWPWSTVKRSNSILMATVRNTFFRELDDLQASGRLHGLLYLHLKRDLRAAIVRPGDGTRTAEADSDSGSTSYGMPRWLQRHLAGLRTDLDVFSRAEAYALMLSGYRMTSDAVPTDLPDFPVGGGDPVAWVFQELAPAVDRPRDSAQARALAGLLRMAPPLASRRSEHGR